MLYATSVRDFRSGQNAAHLDKCIADLAEEKIESMTALYQSTSVSVYSFALSILKNPQDAEDVLHDTYVNIYSAAGSYRSTGKPMAWILTIAKNLSLRKLREHKVVTDIPQEEWETYLENKANVSADDRMIISETMKILSDEERQIVILHAVSGFKYREIAELLGLPLATVLSKYHRAIIKTKKYIDQERRTEQ
jgi:RNA polymerase sigma-70 factor (ECF subfamily)